MSNQPYIHTLTRIYSPHVTQRVRDGRWFLAVSEPYTGGRIQAAWAVLTGRAYAFRWPKLGELEDAIREPRS